MAQYVHPDVREAGESSSSLVSLAVVPAEGCHDRVVSAARERDGAAEDKSLGMLRVELPAGEIDEFVELDSVESVSLADASLGDLDEGNSQSLRR